MAISSLDSLSPSALNSAYTASGPSSVLPSASDISSLGNLDLSLTPSTGTSSFDTSGLGSPAASDAGSSSAGGILSDLTGLLESPMGELAAYGGLTAYGLSQASAAQQQNQGYANQILTASQPFLTAGQNLLTQAQSGTLPAYAQATVNFDTTEGQNIINSGQALQTIANQNFAQYSSGQLKPADALQLQQQVAAQKQQVASQLGAGGNVDSSVLAAYNQQIDQNASITQQNILNSYYQTGDSAYNEWLTSTTAGAQLMNEGSQFAQQTFQNMMQDALGLDQIGMAGLTSAIGLEIQSNTQLSQEVSQLMSNMAAAYAYTVSGPGSGGAGGAAGGAGGAASNLLNSIVGGASKLYGALTGSGSISANDAAQWASGAVTNGALAGSDVSNIGSALDLTSSNDAALSDLLSSEGFSAAGGAAAAGLPAGMSAAVGAAPTAEELATTQGALTDSTTISGGGSSLSGGVSTGLAAVGAGLSLANEIKTYQSGATASDAISGAETGASIGTAILPGVGTAIGAGLGAVGGAIASAFGGGKTDPETLSWNNIAPQLNANPQLASSMTGAQAYQALAGMMDAKNNSAGHSTNLELKFGRMGEGAVVNQMANWINSAVAANPSLKNASASQLYSQVVAPKLKAMGAYVNPTDIITSTGTKAGSAVDGVLMQLISLWQSGQLTSASQVGISGQTIGGLPSFAGASSGAGAGLPTSTATPRNTALTAAMSRYL